MRPVRIGRRAQKYGAERARSGEQVFDSRLEARRYDQLLLLEQAGEIAWFTRQPRFDLGGGVIYRPDFLVVGKQLLFGNAPFHQVWVEDCKGHVTQVFHVKHRLFRARYPKTELRILSRAEVGR